MIAIYSLKQVLRAGMLTCVLSLTIPHHGSAAPSLVLSPVPSPWPTKVFAPYAYIPYEDTASTCLAETGQKYYTLAFILGDPKGQPAWDGVKKMEVAHGFYANAIQAIRAKGGDVIVSFGGADGKELALTTADPTSLAATYQQVIDRYQLTWLDFDIEGKTLANQPVNQRRNLALQQLQASNPGLRITFTLAGDPTGMESDALQLLADAKARGVRIESVNIMTMDYADEVAAGEKMGVLAVSAVKAAHAQLVNMGLDTKIGITPMIGVNDVKSVVFGPEDAAKVMKFARKTDWVRSVSFWSINRDQAKAGGEDDNSGIPQTKWEFTDAFKSLSN